MINFDYDKICYMLDCYLGAENSVKALVDDLVYLKNKLDEEAEVSYCNNEINRVMNSFKLEHSNELAAQNIKAIKGVKSQDIAFIAAHVGFLFGALFAENHRLNFFEE